MIVMPLKSAVRVGETSTRLLGRRDHEYNSNYYCQSSGNRFKWTE